MENQKIYLFAYGTQKKDHYHDCQLIGATFVAEARTVAKYKMEANASFPFVLKEEGSSEIHGELFEIKDEILSRTDRQEEHPNLFKRELVPVVTEDGLQVDAWMYFGNAVAKYPYRKVEIRDGVFPGIKKWEKLFKEMWALVPKTITLFVYGTLKRGGRLNSRLDDAEFMAEAKTSEKYIMYANDAFPFVVKGKGPTVIHGEVYKIDEYLLAKADAVESHPRLYKREEAEVTLNDGTRVKAWIYFGNEVVKYYEDDNACRKVQIEDGVFPAASGKWERLFAKLQKEQHSSKKTRRAKAA